MYNRVEEVKEHTTTLNRVLNDWTNEPIRNRNEICFMRKVEKSVEIWATNVYESTIVFQSWEIQIIPKIQTNQIKEPNTNFVLCFHSHSIQYRQSSFKLRMVKTHAKRSSKTNFFLFSVLCWIYWIYPCSVLVEINTEKIYI